jgi:hypothetical protein
MVDGREMAEHRLGRGQTQYLHQPGAGYVLSSIVPRGGYSRRSMSSCTILDPLGAQVIHRPRHMLGCGGEDVLGESRCYILKVNCFLLCCTILILSCMREHFCLTEVISEEMPNICFNKATHNVIKDTTKHTHLVSTALYYS